METRKKILWEKSGDYSLNPSVRKAYIEEYIYLSKPTIDIEDYYKLNKYNEKINEGEVFRYEKDNNSVIGDVVYTLKKENNNIILESFRLVCGEIQGRI